MNFIIKHVVITIFFSRVLRKAGSAEKSYPSSRALVRLKFGFGD